jgi:hypothetical protein
LAEPSSSALTGLQLAGLGSNEIRSSSSHGVIAAAGHLHRPHGDHCDDYGPLASA